MSYPAGWLVCSALTLFYFRRAKLSNSRLVDDPEDTPSPAES